MTAALAHRGPDDTGLFTRDGLALGHRRLAIIDIAGGHQPMSNEDGQVWIVFNGEIYNYKELYGALRNYGHVFSTRSDTEVIVHAYEQWGEDCVKRLRGMFAFAIADYRRQRLLMARDHFGIKPLFYRVGATYLAFASELNALLQVDDAMPSGNIQAIDHFLRLKFIPHPLSVYHNVWKLPPASSMMVSFNGRYSAPLRYWDPAFQPERSLDEAEWLEAFELVVRESVRSHLVADVPFGVFLSGGVDSTLVAMYMSELVQQPVKAFSIGFAEKQFTEVRYAERAATALGIDHHIEIVRPDVATLLPDLVRHHGEPFGDSSAVPMWYLARLARAHVPMVLSGDGGDEAFAGYARYQGFMRQGLLRDLIRLSLSPRHSRDTLRLLRRRVTRPPDARLLYWVLLMSNFGLRERRQLWRPEWRARLDGDVCPTFSEVARRAEDFDRLAWAQYMDLRTYLPDDILVKVDAATMYHGLEARTPLVDRDVLALAFRLPMRMRRRRGYGAPRFKYLPKQALLRRFTPEFVDRPKMGFGIPHDAWLHSNSPMRPLLDQVLLEPRSRLNELLNHQQVARYVHDLDAGRGNSYAVWVLLVLGIWLDHNPRVSFS